MRSKQNQKSKKFHTRQIVSANGTNDMDMLLLHQMKRVHMHIKIKKVEASTGFKLCRLIRKHDEREGESEERKKKIRFPTEDGLHHHH